MHEYINAEHLGHLIHYKLDAMRHCTASQSTNHSVAVILTLFVSSASHSAKMAAEAATSSTEKQNWAEHHTRTASGMAAWMPLTALNNKLQLLVYVTGKYLSAKVCAHFLFRFCLSDVTATCGT